MINRGGKNIYPREIDMSLEQHFKIAERSVSGARNPAAKILKQDIKKMFG